jgi:hypothetical protein
MLLIGLLMVALGVLAAGGAIGWLLLGEHHGITEALIVSTALWYVVLPLAAISAVVGVVLIVVSQT